MKQLIAFALLFGALGASAQVSRKEMLKIADESLAFSVKQYKHMMDSLPEGRLPKTTNAKTGGLETSGTSWWCSGFYPGTLWYLYEFSKDEKIKAEAIRSMKLVEKEKNNKGTHDLGFMMYCSWGPQYNWYKDEAAKEVLLTSARSLSTRFNPTVGCIKSWDHGTWKFPVIIDNMMNLELLTWATRISGDTSFKHIALTHANTTIANHFRPDNSSFHVIDYNPETGAVNAKKTAQGFNDASAWARGQAWGLYGYTMMYRETKVKAYLDQAVKIAEFILNHPNMPADLVPYWDYNAPEIPNAVRDASAAAVTASALLELSTFVPKNASAKYKNSAVKMLVSLSSPAYRAKEGENNNFILMHSTGHKMANSEVDKPLSYADYYFVEALVRYKQMEGKK
ncbi:glycoside hydrolase family 88 protein [Chitinophaga horti]|uniref:Glycoside hydrolase family 88 protein n=1 Tax=Chitinophaga horti TaxID=2920382 RepID=A0ABY6IWP5_9BACT|nr:glycoside hydrolase family 88 protein [Chitinophaga horti]UYQ91805.1 glycoside hydrolase family 88 protein [Chitinophaga horti]